jgi:hypothetical protein
MFMAALFVIIAKYWKKKTKTSHTLSLNRWRINTHAPDLSHHLLWSECCQFSPKLMLKIHSQCNVKFFGGTGFELRALPLLGRCSTTWAMLPALFALVIFQIGSHIFTWAVLDYNLIYISHLAGMTVMHHHIQLFID